MKNNLIITVIVLCIFGSIVYMINHIQDVNVIHNVKVIEKYTQVVHRDSTLSIDNGYYRTASMVPALLFHPISHPMHPVHVTNMYVAASASRRRRARERKKKDMTIYIIKYQDVEDHSKWKQEVTKEIFDMTNIGDNKKILEIKTVWQ